MNIEIMDDFLPSHYNDYYKNLLSNDQSTISSPFSWYFVDELNEKKYKGNFYFCNEACDIDKNMENPHQYHIYEPILNRLNITMSKCEENKNLIYILCQVVEFIIKPIQIINLIWVLGLVYTTCMSLIDLQFLMERKG